MNWTTIFKREKRNTIMPEPKFEDNWKAERYEENVKLDRDWETNLPLSFDK